MRIIESISELENFKNALAKSRSFWIPIYSDQYRHYVNTRISFIYIYLIDIDDAYIIPFNHKDCICLESERLQELVSGQDIYVLSKKRFVHFYPNEVYDADLVCYWQRNLPMDLEDTETTAHAWFAKWYHNETNINDIVPITRHYERCGLIVKKFMAEFNGFTKDALFDTYDHMVVDNLYSIEQNGLRVDYDIFLDSFNTNNLFRNTAYTEYNIYTSTGRPSNKFGGVNYAALNKENGCRKSFISRFPAGMLIEMDYDSYHLRLMSKLTGYELPKESIHAYFGKHYFGTDSLTQEQYEESKQITFRQLYGRVDDKYKNIEFFKQTTAFIKDLYQTFHTNGYIATPIFGRRITKLANPKMNATKLFNYYLQATETEYSITSIQAVNEVLNNYNTKLTLYTYDSILLDYDMKDGKDCILEIQKAMSNNGDFPVKIKAGANLHDLLDVTSKVLV